MIKKLFTTLYADRNMLYYNKDSGDAIFYCSEMGSLSIDVNNTIYLDDTNFDEDAPETIIHIRLLDWCIKFEKHKAL